MKKNRSSGRGAVFFNYLSLKFKTEVGAAAFLAAFN